MKKSVVLISENSTDVDFAREISRSCGLDFHTAVSVDRLQLPAGSASDIAVAISEGAKVAQCLAFQERFGHLALNQRHFIASPEQLRDFDPFSPGPAAGHLIVRKQADPVEAGQHYARICRAILSDRTFGLASFFEHEINIETLNMTESIQKGFAASSVADHIMEKGLQKRIATSVANAVDELVMNAMFDAPVDEKGNAIYEKTSRQVNLKLGATRNVELQLGGDDRYLGVTVIDNSGSVDRSKVLSHFSKGFTDQQNVNQSTEKAGAGLGLAMIYRSAGSLFFVSKPGERTEVTAFFETTERVKDFKRQYQFVSTWMPA